MTHGQFGTVPEGWRKISITLIDPSRRFSMIVFRTENNISDRYTAQLASVHYLRNSQHDARDFQSRYAMGMARPESHQPRPGSEHKSKYISCFGMRSGNELPDVALLFPCSILTLWTQILRQNVHLESRSATFPGQRNRIFRVVFPVCREFGRRDYRLQGEPILPPVNVQLTCWT
jgi:hypothetical protein